MRILYLDLDSMRPDHLGCYGYARNTSPNIDAIAATGVRFTDCYCSDAPCLPSRTALFSGRFGIHTGVVGHGGTAADLPPEGESRGFKSNHGRSSWMKILADCCGMHTVTISSFAERHSAWHFHAGFNEVHNSGKTGRERADEVTPIAIDWLRRQAKNDHWFLHVNFWDAHMPYRTPEAYGNPFSGDNPPTWLTGEALTAQRQSYGPCSAREPWGWNLEKADAQPHLPGEIATLADYRAWIDGYDTAVRYMDHHIGRLLEVLEAEGVLDDTAIIVSSDHGENLGELNVYGNHQTADLCTCRIPLIIRWPGLSPGVDDALHYHVDLPPTVVDLLDGPVPATWDGENFAATLRDRRSAGRDFLVLSQCAWCCQRAVRFEGWLMIKTYHDAYMNVPPTMLFDVEADPHETRDLAADKPDIVARGESLLERWHTEMMTAAEVHTDPLQTVLAEGGPYHTKGKLEEYCRRLETTDRHWAADKLREQYNRGA